MIFDTIAHADSYLGMHPLLDRALQRIRKENLADLPLGRTEWGEGIYAMVSTYETKAENPVFEAHKVYADIQMLLSGTEAVDVAALENLHLTQPYDPTNDAAFYQGQGHRLVLTPGSFVVLLPQDGHAPCRAVDVPQAVRKLVVKVPL